MSDLSKVVDSLEDRISKLIQNYNNLKKTKLKLEEEVTLLSSQQNKFNQEIDEWREKCKSLKLANSWLKQMQSRRSKPCLSN